MAVSQLALGDILDIPDLLGQQPATIRLRSEQIDLQGLAGEGQVALELVLDLPGRPSKIAPVSLVEPAMDIHINGSPVSMEVAVPRENPFFPYCKTTIIR